MKQIVRKIDHGGLEFVIVEETDKLGNKTQLFQLEKEFQAEQLLGRPLLQDESVLPSQFGGVKVERYRSLFPRKRVEVKDVPGEAADYFYVSSDGFLISKRNNRIVAQNSINKYPGHITKIGGRQGKNVVLKTHRCVALAFINNPENKPEVNHKDGVKDNPSVENLEWVSSKENMQHAADNSLLVLKLGDEASSAKFSAEEINEIRAEQGTKPINQIALERNVHRSTIREIFAGRSYSNVVTKEESLD